MTTSAEKIRAWKGPAILSFGFRPFFLFGSIWAALAMALWVVMLTGRDIFPTAFDPVSWHAHEFLFGYRPRDGQTTGEVAVLTPYPLLAVFRNGFTPFVHAASH